MEMAQERRITSVTSKPVIPISCEEETDVSVALIQLLPLIF
jgi:hypothetical protein